MKSFEIPFNGHISVTKSHSIVNECMDMSFDKRLKKIVCSFLDFFFVTFFR